MSPGAFILHCGRNAAEAGPPLRERGGDVTLLANYFLQKYAELDTRMIKIFDPEVIRFFESVSLAWQ
jgi:transcriptional regulator with GAF, ATPase, and Fis domain